ncbi:MAG: redoxin domain-containing protein [Clostridia bacterium]|nr:redoxin domain-containing protein [Clostridia bacterium]MBR5279237.1 redoxin domain-containing protein [Clostridia bacterium]
MKKLVLILLSMVMLICGGCSNGPADTTVSDLSQEKVVYTLSVTTEGGMPLSGVRVYVYNDKEQTDLAWAGVSEKDGSFKFSDYANNSYTVVLQDVPVGYISEESYTVDNTSAELKLKAQLVDIKDADSYVLKLGGPFYNLEFTDVNGNTYKISELLKTKRAVVLNFWFIGCGPCRNEFPYMQESYLQYKDKIEILAVNPTDGTNATVSAYANELGLTFPMVSSDSSVARLLNITAFPTTIVIDKYGTMAYCHVGSITNTSEFNKLFGFFCDDNYKQTTILNISDIK